MCGYVRCQTDDGRTLQDALHVLDKPCAARAFDWRVADLATAVTDAPYRQGLPYIFSLRREVASVQCYAPVNSF